MKTFYRYLELLKKYFAVILSCIFIGFIIYYSASIILIKVVEQFLKELAEQSAYIVEMELKNHLNILETIAKTDSITDPSIEISKKLEILESYNGDSRLLRMNLADENGNLLSTNNEEYNISKRDYFQNALRGISYISDPFSSIVDGSQFVMFSVPVYYEGQLEYILSAFYQMDELFDMFEDISIFESGDAFMIDSKGVVIADKDRNLVRTQFNVIEAVKADQSLKQLADLGNRMVKGETGAGQYFFRDVEKYMAYSPVKGTTWSLAVTAPKQEVLGGISRLLNLMLLSLAASGIVFILIHIYFSYLKKRAKKYQITSRTAIDVANIAIIKFDYSGHITDFNEHAQTKLGYSTDDLIGEKSIFDFLYTENSDRLDSIMTNFQNGIVEKDFELALKTSDGETLYFLFNINQPLDEEYGSEIELMGIDLTERVKDEKLLQEKHEELSAVYEELAASEEELKQQFGEITGHQLRLRESEERYALIVDASGIGIWDINVANNDFYYSKRWKEIMGYKEDTPLNILNGWKDRIHPEERKMVDLALNDYLHGRSSAYEIEYRIKDAAGGYNWVRSVCKALWDSNGNVLRIAGAHTDITQKKMYEDKIARLAYYDSLTGLYNKVSLMDKFSKMLADDSRKVALFFMDLDNFKLTNDSYGHAVGDQLLVHVAKALMSVSQGSSIVSRLGGDEFAILTKDFESDKALEELAEKLVKLIDNAFKVGSCNIIVSLSIGIAVYPSDAKDFDGLLKNADTAMYKAKENGKNQYVFYNPSMNEAIYEKLHMQSCMKKAISDREFLLYYQPLFTADDKKLIGFEALIRWTSPEMGAISPARFIPAAEETRLILPIGAWVLQTACDFLKRLHDLDYTGLTMSINISILQLQQPGFAQYVLEILEKCSLQPDCMELEITESVLIQYIDEVADNIAVLKSNGIKIALDDFGTGYSSLNYLTQLPINTLKIDKSFIQRIGQDDDSKLIIGSIIFISKKMGLKTIAEGVETAIQLDYLKEIGCDIIQGFLLGKPQPEEYIMDLVKKEQKGKHDCETGV